MDETYVDETYVKVAGVWRYVYRAVDQYGQVIDVLVSNNRIECDHGRLRARLRPMRCLRTDQTASNVIRGHAFVQNLRRGHYELGVEARHHRLRTAAAFDELSTAI